MGQSVKKKILLIDDEREFCELIKTNLQRSGYDVTFALRGQEGLQLARKDRPDMILLDIMMPDMDGFAVLKSLKTDEATVAIPVVMVSARTDDDAKLRSMSLYNEEYITKPVDLAQLRNCIAKIFACKDGA
jgi:DNA-binding response OmpR family regulator